MRPLLRRGDSQIGVIGGKDGGEAAIFSPLPHVQIGSSFRPQREISSASLSMCCENTSLLPQVELKIDVVKSHSKKKTNIAPYNLDNIIQSSIFETINNNLLHIAHVYS